MSQTVAFLPFARAIAKVFAAVSAVPAGTDLPQCMRANKMPYIQDAVGPYFDDDYMAETGGLPWIVVVPGAVMLGVAAWAMRWATRHPVDTTTGLPG